MLRKRTVNFLATDSEFAARSGCLLFVKRIIKADFDLLAGNIPHPRYAVGPGFECPSRIVVARRLRKSAASVTPCLVEHRLQKQHLVVFTSLTGSGAPRIKHFFIFIIQFGLNKQLTPNLVFEGLHNTLLMIYRVIFGLTGAVHLCKKILKLML